jgi:protein TonB
LTPTLLISPEPVYPAAARARQIQGTVQLQAVIDTGGNVTGLQLENAVNMALAQAAMDAVKQWKYRPAMLNGQPVDFPTSITLNFSLVD